MFLLQPQGQNLPQDAIRLAICAVARVGDLETLFCGVLITEVYHLCGQLAVAQPYDPVTLAALSDTRPTLG